LDGNVAASTVRGPKKCEQAACTSQEQNTGKKSTKKKPMDITRLDIEERLNQAIVSFDLDIIESDGLSVSNRLRQSLKL
jgi:hypothetical protein